MLIIAKLPQCSDAAKVSGRGGMSGDTLARIIKTKMLCRLRLNAP